MKTFHCLHCKSTLPHEVETKITCSHCLTVYPVLHPGIPLLLRKPSLDAIRTMVQYDRLIAEYRLAIRSLRDSLTQQRRSADTVNTLIGAYETNIQLFLALKKKLEAFVELADFVHHVADGSIPRERYNTSLNYLRRDWTGGRTGEEELSQIMTLLGSGMDAGTVADGPILFLGAGLARIPVEYTKLYQDVYAVDNSLNMAALFGMVQQGDISFYDIQLKNNQATDQLARKHTASASLCHASIGKVNYIVADSLDLPFPDHFFSAVVSIYFTDVMPFDKQFEEIKRVTRPGGLFMHYGPLDYHHKDVSCMYSFEELKERCFTNGYSLVHEDSNRGTHCRSEASGLSKIYTNWMAIFRKATPAVFTT